MSSIDAMNRLGATLAICPECDEVFNRSAGPRHLAYRLPTDEVNGMSIQCCSETCARTTATLLNQTPGEHWSYKPLALVTLPDGTTVVPGWSTHRPMYDSLVTSPPVKPRSPSAAQPRRMPHRGFTPRHRVPSRRRPRRRRA